MKNISMLMITVLTLFLGACGGGSSTDNNGNNGDNATASSAPLYVPAELDPKADMKRNIVGRWENMYDKEAFEFFPDGACFYADKNSEVAKGSLSKSGVQGEYKVTEDNMIKFFFMEGSKGVTMEYKGSLDKHGKLILKDAMDGKSLTMQKMKKNS